MVDELILLLSSAHVKALNIVEECRALLACEDVSLFTEQFIKKLAKYKHLNCIIKLLLPFITWFDYSILTVLVSGIKCDAAENLLEKFGSLIDENQPIILSAPSQLMIPLDESDYTLVATKYNHFEELTIKKFSDIKTLLLTQWHITEHAIQLVAVHAAHSILYWMVPESIAQLIENLISKHQLELKERGIIRSAVFPKRTIKEGKEIDVSGNGLFCYLHASESKVCIFYAFCSTLLKLLVFRKIHPLCLYLY